MAKVKTSNVKKAAVKKTKKTTAPRKQVATKKFVDSVNYMSKNGKNIVVYLLLAWLFGIFGAHKFYIGKKGQGITMLLLTIFGLILVIPLFVTIIWSVIDVIVGLIHFTNPDDILSGK